MVEKGYIVSRSVYNEIYEYVKSNRSLNWVLNNKQDSIALETIDDVTIASIYLLFYHLESASESQLLKIYEEYLDNADINESEYYYGIVRGIYESVNVLGYKIEGINA